MILARIASYLPLGSAPIAILGLAQGAIIARPACLANAKRRPENGSSSRFGTNWWAGFHSLKGKTRDLILCRKNRELCGLKGCDFAKTRYFFKQDLGPFLMVFLSLTLGVIDAALFRNPNGAFFVPTQQWSLGRARSPWHGR